MVQERKKTVVSPPRPSFLRITVWVLIFFLWSSWMFVLGIMAGKGMIPDSLKLENIVSRLPVLGTKVQNPPVTEQTEEAEQEESETEPEFGFFDRLTGNPTAPAESKPPEFRYTVQLVSLQESAHADAFIQQLQKKGVSGYTHRIHSSNGTWFVVRSGEFDSYAEAESFAQDIKRRLKIDPLVKRLPN